MNKQDYRDRLRQQLDAMNRGNSHYQKEKDQREARRQTIQNEMFWRSIPRKKPSLLTRILQFLKILG
jgi:hypothetical protein